MKKGNEPMPEDWVAQETDRQRRLRAEKTEARSDAQVHDLRRP